MGFRQLTRTRTGFAVLTVAASILGAAAGFAQTIPIKVALEGPLTGAHAPFVLAEDRGYYRAEGITVAIEPQAAPPDAISRVATGLADLGLADINALARFREQHPGTPVKAVFMLYNKPAYAIVARKSRGISVPADLEGKRIGAPPGEMASLFWPAFAKLNGIDATKVKVENIAAAVREPMLAAGQIDAVTATSYTAYMSLKERGVPLDDLTVLQMADYGLPLYGKVIIVNTDFAAARPDAVKAFLRAFTRSLRETIRSPARAVESVLKRNDAAKKEIELERLRIAIRENIVTEEVEANGLGGVEAERFGRGIEILTQALKPKAKIEPADLFDASFLPPAAERRLGAARPG